MATPDSIFCSVLHRKIAGPAIGAAPAATGKGKEVPVSVPAANTLLFLVDFPDKVYNFTFFRVVSGVPVTPVV